MNPLLESFTTPFETIPFEKIQEDHFLPAITEALQMARKEVEAIKAHDQDPTFENTLEALEKTGERLSIVRHAFFNLNSADTNEELQKIAREISPLLTEYANDILLDRVLFQRIKTVYDQKDQLVLSAEQATLLDNTYRSFIQNGALLEEEAQEKLRNIDKEKAELGLRFGENVLAENNAFRLVIESEDDLGGLPETIQAAAKQKAQELGISGWVFTLEYPSFIPFMTYADNRTLREEMYQAFMSRGAKGDERDNQEIVLKLVKLRHERARLLGYESHAQFVLQERMAESPEKVMKFLEDLKTRALPAAKKDMEELQKFAETQDGLQEMRSWDHAYYAEKLKKQKFSIDDELLKPYFRLESTLDGVFEVSKRLYGLDFSLNEEIPVYHPDVQAYEVKDEMGEHLAVFYVDLFPRPGKRSGAWMTLFREQSKTEGRDRRPHISIVCNFTRPTAELPSLLTFREVQTLFHEFGHALHGMLAQGKYSSLSGTNVYWDFVELPSQIMENWTYEKEALDIFARHFETQESIPLHLIQKIKESSNFMEGYQTIRQISFGLLDMAWHSGDPTAIENVIEFEVNTMVSTQLYPRMEGTCMSTGFSHIFNGGYSSGYYSYKWAEVLDADAFELFLEKGIFHAETAHSFRDNILSKGGSEHPMVLYKRFRGQEPQVEALLKRSGLISAEA